MLDIIRAVHAHAVVCGADGHIKAAAALGRELACLHAELYILGSLDMGNDNALGAHLKSLADLDHVGLCHTDQRAYAGKSRCEDSLTQRGDLPGAVLCIDKRKIKSVVREVLYDRREVAVNSHSEHRTFCHFFFKSIVEHIFFLHTQSIEAFLSAQSARAKPMNKPFCQIV